MKKPPSHCRHCVVVVHMAHLVSCGGIGGVDGVVVGGCEHGEVAVVINDGVVGCCLVVT